MGPILLPVTLITAAAMALINVWLTLRIGRTRGSSGVSLGDGGDETLVRRMRAQANLVENAPFFLILLGLVELARGTSLALWAIGALFVVGRLVHVLGMDGMKHGRTIGSSLTALLLLVLAIWAILLVARPAERHARPDSFELVAPRA
jgi:uncharacterized protein